MLEKLALVRDVLEVRVLMLVADMLEVEHGIALVDVPVRLEVRVLELFVPEMCVDVIDVLVLSPSLSPSLSAGLFPSLPPIVSRLVFLLVGWCVRLVSLVSHLISHFTTSICVPLLDGVFALARPCLPSIPRPCLP